MLTQNKQVLTGDEAVKSKAVLLLRERILEGRLRFGESLPSERRLSEELGVGRAIVRLVLAELDREGLLQRRDGERQRTVAFNRGDDVPRWLRQSVIVLTLPDVIESSAAVRSRWLKYTSLGTMEYLRQQNVPSINLGIGSVDSFELRRLAQGRPLGVLIPEMNSGTAEAGRIATMFRDAGVPIVCYGGSPELAAFDRVASDHEGGSYNLTNAAIARGARQIVQCWPNPWDQYWFLGRDAGYRRAMLASGLVPREIVEFPQIVTPSTQRVEFDYAVKQVAGFLLPILRDSRPDALLLSSDRDVPYAAAALRLHGLIPGKDVFLAGYDHYWNACEECTFEPCAPTWTVDKTNEQVGQTMVQLLLDRVANRLPAGPRLRVCSQVVIDVPPAVPPTVVA